MSKFIYHIHYIPGSKMGKPDGLSRYLEEEKSEIDECVFDEGQLLNLENNDMGEEEDMADVELEGIDMTIQEKKNRL